MWPQRANVSVAFLVAFTTCVAHTGRAETISITADVKEDSSIAVGFGHLGEEDDGPYVLNITLSEADDAKGEIDYSECEDDSGEYIWQPDEIHGTGTAHTYTGEGALTNVSHAAFFSGTFTTEGEGDGEGDKPAFDVAVNEIDVDVDSLNQFQPGRLPTHCDEEDAREFLGDNPPSSTAPGMSMFRGEGWAPIVVDATVRKPATFQLAASGDTGAFQFSQDGSTVLPDATIFASENVDSDLSRTAFIRPHPDHAALGNQVTITGTITPDDNSNEAVDKVIVTVGIDLYIDDVSPHPTVPLPLGDHLTVHYGIHGPVDFSFDYVELHVYNSSDVLVYRGAVPDTSVGMHETTWEGATWNQSPHPGAYANPTNGPYQVRLVGIKGGSEMASNTITIDTVLILELQVRDHRPAADEISSGICPNAVNASHPAAIVLGVQPDGDDSPTLGTDAAEFSNITPADLDNDPTTSQIPDALVTQEMASGLADGSYHVVIKGLRDKAGNVGAEGYPASGDVSVINDWTIRMH